jgi:hypothetical protein
VRQLIGHVGAPGLEATFVPGGDGRVLAAATAARSCSVSAAGVDAYVAQRKTMGIPLLYPWANRLSRRRFGSPAGRS